MKNSPQSGEKKVLHILNEIEFSGAEIMLKDAAELFIRNNLDLYALSTGDVIGSYAGTFNEVGYKTFHLPFKKSLKFLRNIYSFFKRGNFEIIHIHTERGFFWYALIARLAGIKCVVRTIHNIFPFRGTQRLIRFIQRFVANHMLKVRMLSIGESVAEMELKCYSNKTQINKNWIDFGKFFPAKSRSEKLTTREELGIPKNAIALISVGKCTHPKNHKAILEALKKIHTTTNYETVYLHLGNGHLHSEEQDYAKELGIDQYVTFYGEVKNVRKYLIAADIFLMPSLFEGLGNSLLEAMGCRLPSVGYNVSGIKDLIENGVNGFLVGCNVNELTDGILALIKDKELRNKMGSTAFEKVMEEYNMDNSISQLVNYYQCN